MNTDTKKRLARIGSWLLTNGLMFYALQAWAYHGAIWGQFMFHIMYWPVLLSHSLLCMAALQKENPLPEKATELIRKGHPVTLPVSFLYDFLLIYVLVTTGHILLAIGWAWQSACEITVFTKKNWDNRETPPHLDSTQ